MVVANGDSAFGFNAMQIDTTVCQASNGAWQIDVHNQTGTHGKVVGSCFQNLDHAAMACVAGEHGECVEKVEDLAAAIKRALSIRPALPGDGITPKECSSDATSGVPDL